MGNLDVNGFTTYLCNDESTNVGIKCTNQYKQSTHDWKKLDLKFRSGGESAGDMELKYMGPAYVSTERMFIDQDFYFRRNRAVSV